MTDGHAPTGASSGRPPEARTSAGPAGARRPPALVATSRAAPRRGNEPATVSADPVTRLPSSPALHLTDADVRELLDQEPDHTSRRQRGHRAGRYGARTPPPGAYAVPGRVVAVAPAVEGALVPRSASGGAGRRPRSRSWSASTTTQRIHFLRICRAAPGRARWNVYRPPSVTD
ncbi:hypothetical protein QJS66_17160 [Kocuria rhizophila]|nr:hypothetical protein QJS66_17160 [Kocuria rhizophila]